MYQIKEREERMLLRESLSFSKGGDPSTQPHMMTGNMAGDIFVGNLGPRGLCSDFSRYAEKASVQHLSVKVHDSMKVSTSLDETGGLGGGAPCLWAPGAVVWLLCSLCFSPHCPSVAFSLGEASGWDCQGEGWGSVYLLWPSFSGLYSWWSFFYQALLLGFIGVTWYP